MGTSGFEPRHMPPLSPPQQAKTRILFRSPNKSPILCFVLPPTLTFPCLQCGSVEKSKVSQDLGPCRTLSLDFGPCRTSSGPCGGDNVKSQWVRTRLSYIIVAFAARGAGQACCVRRRWSKGGPREDCESGRKTVYIFMVLVACCLYVASFVETTT